MSNKTVLRGGRLIDPVAGTDQLGDLWLAEGQIVAPQEATEGFEVIDVSGAVVTPGLWDVHVHLREPGMEAAEDVETGCRAAVRGGFTTVVAMPNTRPPLDTAERVAAIIQRGKEVGLARVLVSGCLTKDRAGDVAADLEALAAAGAAVLTDDGSTVRSDAVMAQIMQEAARLNLAVMDHAEDPLADHGGVMHLGGYNEKAGLPGIPSEAEISMVVRDINLARDTGTRVHIQHVSTKEAVEMIGAARKEGLPVSGEATPHHLALCDADVDPANPNFKMNPPLRSKEDREALREGVRNGIIDILATDHAPHLLEAKQRGFVPAPFGIVGLETAVGITYTELVQAGLLSVMDWLRCWTVHPATLLGLEAPGLAPGQPADITVLDLDASWTIDSGDFRSKSTNTPFEGRTVTGRARLTLRKGRIVWQQSPPRQP